MAFLGILFWGARLSSGVREYGGVGDRFDSFDLVHQLHAKSLIPRRCSRLLCLPANSWDSFSQFFLGCMEGLVKAAFFGVCLVETVLGVSIPE